MKIAIIGTGYVGLPTGVGLAELGNDVVCVDKDENKVSALSSGKLTIFEDGLAELFEKNVHAGRIKFTTQMKEAVASADIVMIAVGTPPHPFTKEADMQYIHAAAYELAEYLDGYTVVAVKSTVPVGTGDDVEAIIRKVNPTADFDVISLPEFLREGFAIHDFFNPDRIVVGANSDKAREVMKKLYQPFENKTQFLFVKRRSSETIKYASNAFLAMKIHYINEMANFCEKSGADIKEVAQGMGLDSRIGKKFLNPGPGYGGSCFPKDTNAMAQMAKKFGVHLHLIETTIAKNDERKAEMAERILSHLSDRAKGRVAVLGLAFKGGTDDCRESPAMDIVRDMLKINRNICVYDPKALDNARKLLIENVDYATDIYQACKDAEVIAVLTEWEDFRNIDFSKLKHEVLSPCIVDLRNIINQEEAVKNGFEYYCIGQIAKN